MPNSQDAKVDLETLDGLDEGLKAFVWGHDQTMSKVWNETKTVRQHIESAIYYWEDKVEGCEANLRYCYDAAAAHGGGDCWREQNALDEARGELASAEAAKQRLDAAESLMERADKDYRYFLETDVYRGRRFLQQKAEIVGKYRASRMGLAGSSMAPRASTASDQFEKTVVQGAAVVAGTIALGAALTVIAAKEISRRRQGLAHTPASGAREVAALVGDGQFVAEPLPATPASGAFAAIYAEPTSGLLLASHSVPRDPDTDEDARGLQLADPDETYRMAIIADPSDESVRRLFGRSDDGGWVEILPDEDENPEYPDDQPPALPEDSL